MKKTHLVVFLLMSTSFAQERYLVSPNEEVIPIGSGQKAMDLIRGRQPVTAPSSTTVCSDKVTFGHPPSRYPTTRAFYAHHKDVIGQWYTVRAPGTIDTIFFQILTPVNAFDSTIYLRVHSSNIGFYYGPGIRPGPFDPPCQNWGYWVNTNDLDQGVAAFPEEATDTAWISTIGGTVPSGRPFEEERWGFGGFPMTLHPNAINSVAMSDLGDTIGITVGENLFFSMRIPTGGVSGHLECSDEGRGTAFALSDYPVSPSDEDYPSRNWKFYEHDRLGCEDDFAECPGIPRDSIRRGWMARGGLGPDSTSVAVYNIWYSMTVTSNAPPAIESVTRLGDTFPTSGRDVSAIVTDCNVANPANAGLVSVVIRYFVNGVPQPDALMTWQGGDTWAGSIPGQGDGDVISYRVVATDLDGETTADHPYTYRVIPYGTAWYAIDTGIVCDVQDIRTTGTTVANVSFFLPPTADEKASPTDDGTSGPHDMGYNFTVFGDTFRYCWIGVNGGIALTIDPTDTQDVNADGYWLPNPLLPPWNLPGQQKEGRGDYLTAEYMPGMYIAAFGADYILEDSSGTYGRIVYGNNGDSCLFIVEWDSIGMAGVDTAYPDATTFRVILNRCTGSVEFQYENVGSYGLDTLSLCGLQADSNETSGPIPGYVMLNRLGYPQETRPRDTWCVRFSPTVGRVAEAGWNMVAVSLLPNDSDYTASALFPTADAGWYCFPYVGTCPPELSPGKGYWMKFPEGGRVGRSGGTFFWELIAPVQDRWNMIGGPSGYVQVGSIVADGTSITTPFYGYAPSGYYIATVLEPGKAYWVKVDGAGTLAMTSTPSLHKTGVGTDQKINFANLNQFIITDARGHSRTLYLGDEDRLKGDLGYFELPPEPPAKVFDVRFSSQRSMEVYPTMPEKDLSYDFPVMLKSVAYPVNIHWNIPNPPVDGRTLLLRYEIEGQTTTRPMEASGSALIPDPGVKMVTISLAEAPTVPVGFSLGANYPNPFNPATTIRYSISLEVFVTLKVFNVLGEEVVTLVNEKKVAGRYETTWNPEGLPSGIYFYRVTAGQYAASRKMVLMK